MVNCGWKEKYLEDNQLLSFHFWLRILFHKELVDLVSPRYFVQHILSLNIYFFEMNTRYNIYYINNVFVTHKFGWVSNLLYTIDVFTTHNFRAKLLIYLTLTRSLAHLKTYTPTFFPKLPSSEALRHSLSQLSKLNWFVHQYWYAKRSCQNNNIFEGISQITPSKLTSNWQFLLSWCSLVDCYLVIYPQFNDLWVLILLIFVTRKCWEVKTLSKWCLECWHGFFLQKI